MSEQQLISSLIQDYMNAILDNFDEGIYITDSEANTVYLNHSYELISGLKKSYMIGKNMKELVEEGIVSMSGTLLVLEAKKSITMEQSFHTGKRAVITSMPIFDEQSGSDHIVMVVTVVRETTELYSVRRELARSEQLNLAYRNEIDGLRRRLDGREEIIAADEKMKQVLRLAGRIALLDAPVLLTGEAGSGKSRTARYIHRHSERSGHPFMRIDFAAIAGMDVNVYLFGGVDTRSGVYQMGILESAQGGTVYIEEIADLPQEVYGKILALLRYDSCVAGDGTLQKMNLRILAGSRFSPEYMEKQGLCSAEILAELTRFRIEIPSLNERPQDLVPLADCFLQQYNVRSGEKKKIGKEGYQKLCSHSWPGNVTELRNVVQYAAIISENDVISPAELLVAAPKREESGIDAGSVGTGRELPIDMKEELSKIEASYMSEAFSRFGNVREAAESLGFDSSTFVRKRQKYQKQGWMP